MINNKTEDKTQIQTRIETRQTNFELLRIVAMLMIIATHYVLNSEFDFSREFSFNHVLTDVVLYGGKIGSNIFFLITGYFLWEKGASIKSLLKIIFEVLFYSLSVFLLFCTIGFVPLSWQGFMQSVLPITSRTWWFVSVYIILYVLSPVINVMIKGLTKKQTEVTITLMLILWCFVFDVLSSFMDIIFYELSMLLWAILMYCIGAYLKKYSPKFAENNKLITISLLVVLAFATVCIIIDDYYRSTSFHPLLLKMIDFVARMFRGTQINDIIPFLAGLLIFMRFRNINMQKSRLINFIGATTFGIYLLHETLFRKTFWHHATRDGAVQDSGFLFLNMIIAVFFVFAFCFVVDMLRIILIENLFFKMKPIKRFVNKLQEKYKKIWG